MRPIGSGIRGQVESEGIEPLVRIEQSEQQHFRSKE
jgi:hypothetical protein